MQQPERRAAHPTRGADVLTAGYACAETLRQIYQKYKWIETNRKERNNFDRRKGKRREEGREGRTAGRKRQRPSSRILRAPSDLHMLLLLSNSCKPHAIYKCWVPNVAAAVHSTDFSRNMLQTPCH